MLIRIGESLVGPGRPTFIVAEIGINHNGDLAIAKQLIEAAKGAGCDAVKFQKRTVELVYAESELSASRESPFGDTNGDLKRGLEFSAEDYAEIDAHCRKCEIAWFASCWDEESLGLIAQFEPPCFKIASACLTDDELLRQHRRWDRPVMLSTGMSSADQVDHSVGVLGKENLILLHCTSAYPSKVSELNLRMIPGFGQRYGIPVGYSGHEVGLATSVAAVAIGACVVERHITLDRTMWGSDQAASVEPGGMARLVKDIRAIDAALGDGIKRIYESEIPVLNKLRRVRQ